MINSNTRFSARIHSKRNSQNTLTRCHLSITQTPSRRHQSNALMSNNFVMILHLTPFHAYWPSAAPSNGAAQSGAGAPAFIGYDNAPPEAQRCSTPKGIRRKEKSTVIIWFMTCDVVPLSKEYRMYYCIWLAPLPSERMYDIRWYDTIQLRNLRKIEKSTYWICRANNLNYYDTSKNNTILCGTLRFHPAILFSPEKNSRYTTYLTEKDKEDCFCIYALL